MQIDPNEASQHIRVIVLIQQTPVVGEIATSAHGHGPLRPSWPVLQWRLHPSSTSLGGQYPCASVGSHLRPMERAQRPHLPAVAGDRSRQP